MNVDTGLDLRQLVDAAQFISEKLGKRPNSRVAYSLNRV
jgi:isopropylmalate/homocitrate/citramalate synthase